MNIKTKSSILIILTLILGILVGILVDRTVLRQYSRSRFVRHIDPRRLPFILERIIDPEESQEAFVVQIIEKYHKRFEEARLESLSDMVSIMDSLRNELATVLTKEQIAKFDERIERLRRGPFDRPGSEMRPMKPPFDKDEVDLKERMPPPFSSRFDRIKNLKTTLDSLRTELDSLLTDDQKRRIDKILEDFKRPDFLKFRERGFPEDIPDERRERREF